MDNHTTNNEVVEEWRAVPGYEGIYDVSNLGRVRSLDRTRLRKDGRTQLLRGKVLSPNKVGPDENRLYLAVHLYKDETRSARKIHRLVLDAFVGPAPDGMECRHLNGDKFDNRLENLEWGTASENIHDQIGHGTHRNARKTHCIRGHAFDEVNTRIDVYGRRICLSCQRIHEANRPPRNRSQKRTAVKRNYAA